MATERARTKNGYGKRQIARIQIGKDTYYKNILRLIGHIQIGKETDWKGNDTY